MKDKKFFPIGNVNKLGNFEIPLNPIYKNSQDSEDRDSWEEALKNGSLLRPKLEEKEFKNHYIVYKPVYLNIYNEIISSPILTFYCQLNWIEFWTEKIPETSGSFEYHTLQSEIIVYSKVDSRSKKLEIKITARLPSFRLNFDLISDIINQINVFINLDYKIEDLNEYSFKGRWDKSQFFKRFMFKKNKLDDVIDKINELEFQYYVDSHGTLTRKSRTFKEVRIYNLPNNCYLRELFFQILKDFGGSIFKGGVEKIKLMENEIVCFYDKVREVKSYRRELQFDYTQSLKIKDYLKTYLLNYLSLEKEWADRISIRNSHHFLAEEI